MTPGMPRRAVDPDALAARIREVCALMSAHAGAIELVDVGADGAVDVRFTGMCQGCQFRPLTMFGTVEPALMAVPGVTAVRAPGARISAEAAARMRAYAPPAAWQLGPVPGP